ncbi:hypothetical protein AB0469_31640 [Streptomyces sp. NPDC093801]|uniref:hypothetical protein n=1 Tax=Streptomyces sp. NPDC093801 TaxID=3155203 RepID=UPI00344D97BD
MSVQMKRTRVDHAVVADQLRAMPGEWRTVQVYPSRYTAVGMARLVRRPRLTNSAYHPAGSYEATVEMVDNGTALVVRFVGGSR